MAEDPNTPCDLIAAAAVQGVYSDIAIGELGRALHEAILNSIMTATQDALSAEREACAKLVENYPSGDKSTLCYIAELIRARDTPGVLSL
jgi:hypothetical protein